MVDLLRLNAEVLAQQIDAATDANDPDTAIQKRLLWGIMANAATAVTEAQARERANRSGPYSGQRKGNYILDFAKPVNRKGCGK